MGLASACLNSGTYHLSEHFKMGDFAKEIHFGGKQLVIWGNNATLDARQKGRFFSSTAGPGDDDDHEPAGKTSLELHDLVMQNGFAEYVSFAFLRVLKLLFSFSEHYVNSLFAPCPAASHATKFYQ